MVMAISSKSRCWRPSCTARARTLTAADPIVRVDARRLRDKLRQYYASAPYHEVVISIPKGSYTPAFEVNGNGTMPGLGIATSPAVGEARAGMSAPRRGSRLWLIAVACVLVGSVVWLVIARRAASSASPPFRLITVTTFPGAEGMPSLSPDGNQVAFTWTGPSLPKRGHMGEGR